MLSQIIDETVQTIRDNKRTDGLDLPIQAHRAAHQVLERRLFIGFGAQYLTSQIYEMQEQEQVIPSWMEFLGTSPVDFIAAAAKAKMEPGEYDNLLHARTEAASSSAAYAE